MDQPVGFLLYGLMVVLDKAANPEKGGGFCVIASSLRAETGAFPVEVEEERGNLLVIAIAR